MIDSHLGAKVAQTPRDFVNDATRFINFIEPPWFRAARASHLQAMA
jgi:hypothetical protein